MTNIAPPFNITIKYFATSLDDGKVYTLHFPRDYHIISDELKDRHSTTFKSIDLNTNKSLLFQTRHPDGLNGYLVLNPDDHVDKWISTFVQIVEDEDDEDEDDYWVCDCEDCNRARIYKEFRDQQNNNKDDDNDDNNGDDNKVRLTIQIQPPPKNITEDFCEDCYYGHCPEHRGDYETDDDSENDQYNEHYQQNIQPTLRRSPRLANKNTTNNTSKLTNKNTTNNTTQLTNKKQTNKNTSKLTNKNTTKLTNKNTIPYTNITIGPSLRAAGITADNFTFTNNKLYFTNTPNTTTPTTKTTLTRTLRSRTYSYYF